MGSAAAVEVVDLVKRYDGTAAVDGLTLTVEENVLTQIEHLRTHPAVRSRVARGELSLHGWVYKLETGEVFQYDAEQGQFSHLTTAMSPMPTAARAHSI